MEFTPLPFEYEIRYSDQHKKWGLPMDTAVDMDERDRQLEDYLAALGTGGAKLPFFVAASDASDQSKAASDYVCDGVADEVEIQAAVDDAIASPHGAALVRFSEGTFHLAAAVNCGSAAVGFRGAGAWGSTNLQGPTVRGGIHCLTFTSGPVYGISISDISFYRFDDAVRVVGRAQAMLVTGCVFDSANRAVYAEDLHDSRIVANTFFNNNYCVYTGFTTYRSAIADNTAYQSQIMDYYLVEPSGLSVLANNASQNSAAFLHSWGYHQGFNIVGNTAICSATGTPDAPVVLVDGNYPGGGSPGTIGLVGITGNTFKNRDSSPGAIHYDPAGTSSNGSHLTIGANNCDGALYLDGVAVVLGNTFTGGAYVANGAAGSLVSNNLLGSTALWGSAPPYTLNEATVGNAESGAGNYLDGVWTP